MRELIQTWTGCGKYNCLESIRQANSWIHSNRPDKFYDNKYALRSMCYKIIDNDIVSWWNDDKCGELCDFIDKLCNQLENMEKDDYYYISVRFMRGHWF